MPCDFWFSVALPRSYVYSKICRSRPLKKKTKNGYQGQLSLNADQKYCRMLEESVSAILSTFILHLSLRPLFCLFLTGRLRQVLLLWDSVIVLCFAAGYFMFILVL